MLLSLCSGLLGSWPNRGYIKTERGKAWGEWYHQTFHQSSFAISCDLKRKTHSTRLSSWDVCSLRFLLFGIVLFWLASWGDSKSVIPFWGLFAGSQRDERPSHLICLCLSWVPRDTHVFNYSSLAWHSPVTLDWLLKVTLKCCAVLRILNITILRQISVYIQIF